MGGCLTHELQVEFTTHAGSSVFSPTELLHFLQQLPVTPVSYGQIRYVTIWKL